MTVIRKILIANRGEIAVRVIRACRRMGIASVAVFSDADARAPFVAMADQAVRLGPPPSSESYLAIDKILAAAALTGADAVHPGYGFLAENAEFAAACAQAGLTFIGPSAEVIRILGSKQLSKRRVAAAGVPVIPGDDGADQDPQVLAARAREIGFPVLLKASAGGGGKGMRIVRGTDGLSDAIAAAKRESNSAFGDDTLLIERYIDRPRHVEVQILGDSHGNLVHLNERECSIQRRHQKIIEETPSPALTPDLREAMGSAAVKVGEAVGYTNAGTVEFILAPDGKFYFLEVNTRLQVEHPITECVTGIDLVREQIRIAQGERLDIAQQDVPLSGAAIECRLYAEDADRGFLPTSGHIARWQVPDEHGLRVDAGVETDSEVGIHYDPMLAKVICHAPSRGEAIRKMIRSLSRLVVHGLVTNREFLIRVLEHPAFREGALDTHFLDTYADDLRARRPDAAFVRRAAVAATLVGHEQRRRQRAILPALEPGYRNNRFQDEWADYQLGDEPVPVRYANLGGGRFRITACGEDSRVILAGAARGSDGDEIAFEEQGGARWRFRVTRDGARWFVQSLDGAIALTEVARFPDPGTAAVEGACVAPMPGKVIKVLAEAGQEVAAGDTLVILEAMKMEHAVVAPKGGTVAELHVGEGDQVDADAILAVVQASE